MKKKKKYIREGGICQFWDQWSNGAYIDYSKLQKAFMEAGKRIASGESSQTAETEISTEAKEALISDNATIKNKEEVKPFNREYKSYEPEN